MFDLNHQGRRTAYHVNLQPYYLLSKVNCRPICEYKTLLQLRSKHVSDGLVDLVVQVSGIAIYVSLVFVHTKE